MGGLQSILSLFHKFNLFNNTGARMLDFIYHMTFKLISLNFISFVQYIHTYKATQ